MIHLPQIFQIFTSSKISIKCYKHDVNQHLYDSTQCTIESNPTCHKNSIYSTLNEYLMVYYWKFNFPLTFSFVWTMQHVPLFFHIFQNFIAPPLPSEVTQSNLCRLPSNMWLCTVAKFWFWALEQVRIRIAERKWNISLSFYPLILRRTHLESCWKALSNDATNDAPQLKLPIL